MHRDLGAGALALIPRGWGSRFENLPQQYVLGFLEHIREDKESVTKCRILDTLNPLNPLKLLKQGIPVEKILDGERTYEFQVVDVEKTCKSAMKAMEGVNTGLEEELSQQALLQLCREFEK